MNVQVRVLAAESFHRRGNHGQRIFHCGGDAQGALELGMLRAGFFHGQLRFFEHACATQVEAFAGIGQRQLTGVAGQ